MKRTLGEAARDLGANLIGEDRDYTAVSSDSRSLPPNALFVALRGPNFDGGDFLEAAAARGAAGALVERRSSAALAQIVVPDALLALQALARSWRSRFSLPIVAVGGSNGKTTVKEMTAAILLRTGTCLATQGNLNNHIGVPLTLLRLAADQRSAVIEMGANKRGDVAELVALARPTVGLITNAGAEHLEGFGDLDGVAQGEGEMVAGLAAAATAVINADDRYADYWHSVATARRVLSFGLRGPPAAERRRPTDFTAAHCKQAIEGGKFIARFTLLSPQGERPIVLAAAGEHNVVNALAAAAAASAAGASLDDIVGGLADFRPVSGRLQLKRGLRASWIIDDSYNANPSSVRAGLDVLRVLEGPTWLVFGDMAELGEHAPGSHAQIGSYALTCGVDRLFAVGMHTARAVDSFGARGEWFADADALVGRLRNELAPGITVLVKGSRVNRLERVVQALTDGDSAHGAESRAG